MEPFRRVTEITSGWLPDARDNLPVGRPFAGNRESRARGSPGSDGGGLSNLAYIYYQSALLQDAREAYSQAIARDPKSPMTRERRRCYIKLGERTKRQLLMRRPSSRSALKVNPRDAASIALVALCKGGSVERRRPSDMPPKRCRCGPKSREIQMKHLVYAILGQAELAMKPGIALGYDRTLILRNDEFVGLRDLPAFKALTTTSSAPKRFDTMKRVLGFAAILFRCSAAFPRRSKASRRLACFTWGRMPTSVGYRTRVVSADSKNHFRRDECRRCRTSFA